MPEQHYTIGEAVSLLDCDRVTLARWLAVENMTPQTDPRDKRIKYLTREQILELARLHGKAIRDETTIGPRLTGVQRDMIARIQQHDEDLARIKRLLGLGTAEPQEPHENVPTPPPSPVPLAEYLPPPERHKRAPQSYYGERLRKGGGALLPPVPDGWISPRLFAEQIGVPTRTFLHHLRPRYDGDKERTGHLEYHQGRWAGAYPGTFHSELLDEEQQEAARSWFATRPRGQ